MFGLNQMNKTTLEKNLLKILIFLLAAMILYRAGNEFYEIAWGTGTWRGEFSRTWAVLYYLFVAFCVLAFLFTALIVWNPKFFEPFTRHVVTARQRLGNFRWLLWTVVLVFPPWFFQYTFWGFVFQKFYIRLIIWIITVCLLAIFASKREQLVGWKEFLASLILTASAFSIVASLKYVNGYPFSLGWSEGNRLWDYSVLFGKELYIYPAGQDIPAHADDREL